MSKKATMLIGIMIFMVVLAGCTNTTPNSGLIEPTGNLVLSIVDAPGDYEEVYINIQKIFVKPTEDLGDTEWVMLGDFSDAPYGINLLDYRIQELILPSTDVPAGAYEQIRIVLDTTGYVKFVDDATHYPLSVGEVEEPSDDDDEDEDKDQEDQLLGDDEQAIDVEYPFWITESAMTEIQIDFNVGKMIEPNEDTVEEDYILITDEVKAIDKAEASEIEGEIAIQDATTLELLPVPTTVTISLYDAADLVNPITVTWPIEEEMDDDDEEDGKAEPGKFKIRGIPAGEYVLTLEAEGYNTVTIEGLLFEDGDDLELGEGSEDDKDEEDDEESIPGYTITGATIVDEHIVMTPVQ